MARTLRLQPPPDPDLEIARAALARHAWDDARVAFERSLARAETPEALEGLASTCSLVGEIARASALRDRAFRAYRERGDARGAARVATAIGVDAMMRWGNQAVADGCFGRAARLLADLAPGPEHAWIELRRASLGLIVHGDPARVRPHLERGLALARELDLPDAEAYALGVEGALAVSLGEVEDGMRRLDEAATAAYGGEIPDIETAGLTYCSLLYACESVGDHGRASQWLERLFDAYERQSLPSYVAFCRAHFVAVLTASGEWERAERELEATSRVLERTAPGEIAEMRARLGELRRRQGRWDEATRLFASALGHPLATLGRAALALDRGEPAEALDHVCRYLRQTPTNRPRRAAGHALAVRAGLALGRPAEARAARDEIATAVAVAGTELLRGELHAADAALAAAACDLDGARRGWEDALDVWAHGGLPYEAGLARLELAAVLQRAGLAARAAEEARGALADLERLGAAAAAARARAFLAAPAQAAASAAAAIAGAGVLPAVAAATEPPALAGLTARQREVLRLVARGLSNREIGEQLGVSEFTIKRHVADILGRLDLPSRAAAAGFAALHRP